MQRKCLLLLVLMASAAPAFAQDARPDAPLLKETTTEFPKADKLEARVMTATLQPGSTSLWHTHAAPVIVYVLDGEFTLELDGRPAITKKAGEAMLEPINVKMRAANRSKAPAKVLIVQVSDPDQPFLHPSK